MPNSVWIILADGVPLAAFTEKDRANEVISERVGVILAFGMVMVDYRAIELPLDPESVKVPE